MAKTSGGLEKLTIAFEPEEVTWLKTQKARPGRPSFAVIVRQAVRAQMAAESADAAPTTELAGRGEGR